MSCPEQLLSTLPAQEGGSMSLSLPVFCLSTAVLGAGTAPDLAASLHWAIEIDSIFTSLCRCCRLQLVTGQCLLA